MIFTATPDRNDESCNRIPSNYCDRQQLWKAVITGNTVTRLIIPFRGRGKNHLKKARGEIWPKQSNNLILPLNQTNTNRNKTTCLLNHISVVGHYIGIRIVLTGIKSAKLVVVSHCRARKKVNSCVKKTKSDEQDGLNIRKYVQVQILNKNIKLQLDYGSDLTIINLYTWKKLGKPTLLRSNKMPISVTRKKLKFEGELITNVTFQGRTLKLKMFVLKNIENLFGTHWMEKFKQWDMPINSFCQKLENLTTKAKI